MGALYLGAHMPTAGGLGAAVRRGVAMGCTAVQVFTSSPRTWAGKRPTPEQVADYRAALEETGLARHATLSHDTYLVNLAAPDDALQVKSMVALGEELVRCHDYGIPMAVSHVGAHMGQGESAGETRAAEALRRVLTDAPAEVTLLMETTAGQGTVLNSTVAGLARIFDQAGAPTNLAVCLDTCHLFSAGYDLTTDEGYGQLCEDLEREVTLERVRAIHVNDSLHPCACRKDRHAHLGQGTLGEGAIRRFLHDPRWRTVPMVIETPDAETEHAGNVARLWTWNADPTPALAP